MGFSKIPVTRDKEARGNLMFQCYDTVDKLRKLHFRDSDFPPNMAEAAALYDTTLTVSGLHAKSFATIDLAKPYLASARLLAQLSRDPEIDRLCEDLLRSGNELSRVTPQEAFHYQTNNRGFFDEARLAELDFSAHGRFKWLSDNTDAYREEWVMTLFENAAGQLGIGAFFEDMPDPQSTVADREVRQSWIQHQATWMRDTVAALPDYAARREDCAELRAMLIEVIPDYAPKTQVEHDMVLFDLLQDKGLRRTGSTMLKLRTAAGKIKHQSDSRYYEHHKDFNDTDWVWLIQTTGAAQIYYQSAEHPYLEDAVRVEPENFKATTFSREQQALAEARNRKREKRREGEVIANHPPTAPSKSVMDSIRGWLNRS